MSVQDRRIGPYRLLRQLGSGGMGEVFVAVHEHLGKEVALKLLPPDMAQDRQRIARVIQEGRALAQFDHPGIVRVIDCNELDDGTVYLAMELLEGQALRDWMRSQPGPLPVNTTLTIARQLAEVMSDIHAKHIIHRDLKPENVFLCPESNQPLGFRLKILDFGIAKVPPAVTTGHQDTQVQTAAPVVLGTTAYMAPEQFRNPAAVTGQADVYALGVMLFELLAGHTPFVSAEPIELLTMHAYVDPPSLSERVTAVPGGLAAFIASMLAKDPSARPSMHRCRDMLGRDWSSEHDACPVPGLAPFSEAQAELFFGRNQELARLHLLMDAAHAGQHRWVQLEGPSGIGKSSLVQAGLLPRLREQSSEGAPRWRIISLRSSDLLQGLAQAMCETSTGDVLPRDPAALETVLREEPQAFITWARNHTPPGGRLLLVLEQLEELFLLEESERQDLDALMSSALMEPGSPIRLLTTLRSDFIHGLTHLPRLARQINEAARYVLNAMEESALTQVIQGMAQRAGLRLSEGLAERMVRDATSEGSQLPLLGHTLQGLWALRRGSTLTHERYEQLGGVGGALARQAEALLDNLGEKGRECAKWLILELVQVHRNAPATRRPRTRNEVLTAAGDNDGLAEEVLRRLSGMRSGTQATPEPSLRLIVLSGGPVPSQQRVDLIHEALLQRLPAIQRWIEHERAWLERSTDLEAAAAAWEQSGCPKEGLPSGTLLAHYRGLGGEPSPRAFHGRRMSERAKRFIDTAMRHERRRTQRNRTLIVASLVAVLTIVTSAAHAYQAQRHAEAEQARAQKTLQDLVKLAASFVSGADWILGRRPFTHGVRDQVLQKIDELLAQLPAQDREHPQVQLAIIKVLHRCGDLAFLDKTLPQAEHLMEKARRLIEKNLAQAPGEPDWNFQLGLNHSKQGKIAQAREKFTEARAHFLRSIELAEQPNPQHEAADQRRTLATSRSELASLELQEGRTGAAIAQYRLALDLLRQNTSTYDRSLLVETLSDLGIAAHRAGDWNLAETSLRDAVNVGREITQLEPGDTYYRWVLARGDVALAKFLLARAHAPEAARLYQEARALGNTLVEGDPDNKRFALILGESLLEEARLAHEGGDPALALQLQERRCKLVKPFVRKDPEDRRFHPLACP